MFRLVFLASLALFVSLPSLAKAPVWEVTKNNQTIYLGGTIHVLSEKDYPLPAAFEQAYSNSDTLVFETDIAAMEDPATQVQLLQVMTFQDGRTLSEVLSEETYAALSEFLASRNIPVNNFDRFTPAGVSLTLTVIELQRLGLGVTSGVDQFFNSRGKNDDKEIEALETITEQIGFIQKLNDADPNKVIQSTLRDTAKLKDMWAEMLSAWRAGDMESLNELGDQSMRDEFPRVAELLIDQRNNNWMQQLPSFFEDPDIEFVLVGALHMSGKTGLITQLQEAGYQVRQLGD